MAHFGAFLGISLLVIVTPGQDTALTIRNTLLGGKRAGAATALGVAAGQATWTIPTPRWPGSSIARGRRVGRMRMCSSSTRRKVAARSSRSDSSS